MVKFLFECGSDPNTADNQGMTPLHAAAQHGHAEILSYLLTEAGVQVDIDSAESVTLEAPEGVGGEKL
jgi:ankyrin repeat protein